MFNHAGIVKHSIIIENKTANDFKYFISPHFETFINIIEIHRVLQEFNIYCKTYAWFVWVKGYQGETMLHNNYIMALKKTFRYFLKAFNLNGRDDTI